MANRLKVKRSATPLKVPTTADLELGEIAVNTYDGVMYIKKDNGTASIVQVGGGSGSGDVVGPSSATDNAVARFDSTTGKLIQNSVVTVSDTGAMAGVASITNPDYITFDTTAAETSATGKLFWDDGDGVLSTGLKGGNVTLQNGTQEYARVYNDSGATLTVGQAVYISGSQGNRVAVKLAKADVEATSFGTIGLVAESIANGAEGFIIVSGALYKLNTTGLTAGATVYLSPTTAGAVTTTKPQAPNQLVVIGWIERVSTTVGSIYVKIDNGYELDELHDVQVTSPQSGNLLIYDATTTPIGVWKNANLTAGTGISVTNGAGSITIANTGVTSVTGTAPIASSGGATPAISISQATTSTNGYLSSTDWNTFNNKYGAGSSPSFAGITDTGNLTFTGTGNRITGDFSNATWNSKVAFQSSTTNGNTAVMAIPNGTSTQSQFIAFNGTDADNSGFTDIRITATDARWSSSKLGTGSYLPLTMYTGGSERLRIDTSGNVGIGVTSLSDKLQVLGAISATDGGTQQTRLSNAGELELARTAGDAYIDFKTSTAEDFDCRISQISDGLRFLTGGNGSTAERMRIGSGGNVGIGTSSPSQALEVNGNILGVNSITIGTGGLYQAGSIYSDSSWGMIFRAKQASPSQADFLWADSANTERMRISAAGNLSIAATTASTNSSTGALIVSGGVGIGGVTNVNNYVNRITGSGNSAWLQQDGTGRVHWYWNTYGGTSPTFTNANEDASALTQHVTLNGSGGAFFHRSASGVGQAAGAPITWTTTLYCDLSTLSWKGNAVLRSDNYNSYAPTLTGTGASGTWGISITGNAATASTANALNSANSYSFTGNLNSSDIFVKRTASPTEGYIYFGNTGTNYVGFNGSSFVSSMSMNFNILGSSGSCTGNAATATTASNTTSISSAVGNSYSWTGAQYFNSNQNTATGSSPPLQAYGTTSGAMMSFHRGGYYAVNMGLDSDNVMRIGGWSAPANLWQLDMSGNNTIAGGLTVGNGLNSSNISMVDSDEGTRTIHCNSNRIGFLNQSGGWGSYCNDDGSWASDVAMYSPWIQAQQYSYGGSGNWNTDFQNTTAYTKRYNGDMAGGTNNPGGTWWFQEDYRHSNASNYWGVQVAWGWEDNANKLATRNVSGGNFGSWVYYLNSANVGSYAVSSITAGSGITVSASQGAVTISSSAGNPIPAGSVMLFYQASAPTGWTQVTTQNNKALRVVSGTGGGTGGSVAFTTAFASQAVSGTVTTTNTATTAGGTVGAIGATTLSTAQIPAHSHQQRVFSNSAAGPVAPDAAFDAAGNTDANNTNNTGGGGSHTHGTPSFTGTSHNHTASSSFSGTAINLAVQYIDVIICSKN